MIAFFGALTLAAGTIIERSILKRKEIKVKFYQTAQFLAIVLVMLPFIPFLWNASADFLTPTNILIFLGVVLLSIAANFATFYSLKWERLGKLESAKITEPLFIILLAFGFSFIFGTELYERNPNVLIPALIAAFALIFSHIKKHHLKFSKYYLAALIGSFFFASELVLSKLILGYFNPLTFYFLRSISILALSFLFFKPDFKKGSKLKTNLSILGTGIIWVIYRLIVYFGYANLGILETTLTIMLGPIFVYFFVWKFLKEKLTWRNIAAGGIILLCIAYVTLINKF